MGNTEQHAPADGCRGVHCHVHNVDEPDGVSACGECNHSFPTYAALLADHNRVSVAMYASYPDYGPFRVETDADAVAMCPHCGHDF